MAAEITVQFRYTPTRRQLEWINPYAREKLFGGAKRGGKSVALAMHIALLSVAYPGNRGLLARKNMTDLKDSTLNEFFNTVPPELIAEHRRGDREVIFQGGSRMLYRGLGEEGEFEKAKSITLGWLAIDEPSEVPLGAYTQLNAQLTHVLPDGTRPPYMALLACNPEPGWVKQRFVDAIVPGGLYVQALPRDNPGLPPGWEDELRASMDPEWVRRYLDGSWDVFEGQVFTELNDRLHNLDNWTEGWGSSDWLHWIDGLRKVNAIDHATTGITTDQQVGIDRDENMFSVGEYYQENRLISEHALGILALQREFGKQDYTLIDPSTAAKTQMGPDALFSYLDEYHRNGINATPAHRASIDVGINLLKEFLHVSPLRRHPFTGQMGSPRWFISRSRCQALWKELTELRKELLPAGGIRFIGKDHAIDCVRYIAMSRPSAAAQKAVDISRLPAIDQKKFSVEQSFRRKWEEKVNGSGSWY